MSLSGKARRAKGLRGELEVTHALREAGFEVKNLDGAGDHLVVRDQTSGRHLHLEVKRQEKIRIELWSRQAEAEAPPGCVAIVVYRRSMQPWRVSLRLDDLLELLQ